MAQYLLNLIYSFAILDEQEASNKLSNEIMEPKIEILTTSGLKHPKAWFKGVSILFCLGAATLGWFLVVALFYALR